MSAQQFFRILRARWLLIVITIAATLGITIAVTLLLPQRYTSTAAVLVDVKGIDPISGGAMPMMPMTGYLATQIDIIKSHSVARRAVELLRLPDNPSAQELFVRETGGRGNIRDWLAELLLRNLEVEPSRDSTLVNVSYTGNDPRFAATVANAFVQSYINMNLDLKIAPAKQTNTFFNEQIQTLKDNLERAQNRLSDYQRQKGIIATDERLDVESNRLNELSSQLLAAQAQTYDSVTRQRQVQEFLAKGQIPDTSPDILANPVIQSLKANLTQLEIKHNELSSKVGKNHPFYIATVAEMNGVKQKMMDEMKTISSALGSAAAIAQRREEQIRNAMAAQRAKVLEMKEVRDEQTVLLREVDNAQKAYDAAMGRMTQTRLESQTTQTNITVINEALEPLAPSFPKMTLNAILAFVLGSMLAVGFALLREMTDRIVRSESDLVDGLGLPVLGVLGREPRWNRFKRLGGNPAPQSA